MSANQRLVTRVLEQWQELLNKQEYGPYEVVISSDLKAELHSNYWTEPPLDDSGNRMTTLPKTSVAQRILQIGKEQPITCIESFSVNPSLPPDTIKVYRKLT